MPTLSLKICPAQDQAVLADVAHALTTITADVLHKRAELTAIAITTVPATQWFIGAKPVQGATAMLDICITEGTNSPTQKAEFVAAAFEALRQHLGQQAPLAPASYVAVHELPATDWGYEGRTQASRQSSKVVKPTKVAGDRLSLPV